MCPSHVVEHPIEISNRFIHDLEAFIQIAKQCKTGSCHKSPFVKEGFRRNVNMGRSRQTPATKKKGETVKFLLLSSPSGTRTRI